MAFFNAFRKNQAKKPEPEPVQPAKPAVVAVSEPTNRRLVSGERVLARCSLELPKHDPFARFRARCEGYIVLNVRGGSLYIAHQFNEESVRRIFPPDTAALIKDFKLYTPEGTPLPLGDVRARFLKLNQGIELTGLVLRFVNLTELQLDILNTVGKHFPKVDGREELAIPIDELHRM